MKLTPTPNYLCTCFAELGLAGARPLAGGAAEPLTRYDDVVLLCACVMRYGPAQHLIYAWIGH